MEAHRDYSKSGIADDLRHGEMDNILAATMVTGLVAT